MRKNRDRMVEVMGRFKEKFVPDKRAEALQKEADHIAMMAVPASLFIDPATIITQEEDVRREVAAMSDDQIAAEMANFQAMGSTLTPEEQAALRIDRHADPTLCPRCHTGYAGGRGWNIERDRCDACGYTGKRGKSA